MSVRWWLQVRWGSRRARWRAFWHAIVRRYPLEICHRCGRRNWPHIGSWWDAPDPLWMAAGGNEWGVLCPPCFTKLAASKGMTVYWLALERGTDEQRRSES